MVLLHSLAVIFAATQALAQKVPPEDCADGVHVIAVRGHGTDNPPYGLSTTTISNLTTYIPGTDAIAVPYNASLLPDIYASVVGARLLKKYIRKYTRSCPNTPIALQGYSQGAIAVMSAMCSGVYTNYTVKAINDQYSPNIIAIVTYGDETRVADAPYNAGTCTAGAPHARVNGWECGPYTNLIRAWCDSDDPDCCVGGDNIQKHYQYPDLYNKDLTEWVWYQYYLWARSQNSGSGSSSSTHWPWSSGSSSSTTGSPWSWPWSHSWGSSSSRGWGWKPWKA